jgi:hypothetical protein
LAVSLKRKENFRNDPLPSLGERVGRHLLIGLKVAVCNGFFGIGGTMAKYKKDKAV